MSKTQTMEHRLEKLEDSVSDWQAALRIRIEGCDSVAKRARELNNTSKEFWRMKAEVADLLLKDLATCLIQCFPLEVERGRVQSELTESFPADAVVGVFPQGAPWGSEKSIDIRFRPGLRALRANHLVKHVLAPKIKIHCKDSSCKIWVPLSSAEMSKRNKRRDRGRSRSTRR